MAAIDPEEANVPWGKYSYNLEGLATGCYLEGVDTQPRTSRISSSVQRIRFRIELPARCFVLSVAVKLPDAPPSALSALDDIVIERALSHGDFQVVFDPAASDVDQSSALPANRLPGKSSTDPNNDSPRSVDQTSSTHQVLSRKKLMEVRRAADSLRLTMSDIDESSASTTADQSATDSDGASDVLEQRTLGIVVIGYTRGQTPAPNRLRILLNASASLPLQTPKVDRAEINGLLGLAFLGSRRYRQAAELLQRAADLHVEIAFETTSGQQDEDSLTWAAELNLLAAHAYFEHMTMCNDGIVRLIQVASAFKSPSEPQLTPRDTRDLSADFLDLRTELLNMLESLIHMLVQFLTGSSSPAVRMAAARMIEFISEQLGCGMAPYMSIILNTALRCYPSCVPFGARERAAASSFSYDSMEDCFERLTDICCRLFPLTEHTVLHRLYENTLVPIFLDAFHESDYIQSEPEADIPEDLMSTSVAQTLRVIYLSLMVLGADARVPPSLTTRILNILVLENGLHRTALVLRRTALHTWDSVSRALTQSASGNSVKAFEEHMKALTSFIPKMLIETVRIGFEYRELEADNGEEVEVFEDKHLNIAHTCESLDSLLRKRKFRTEIADRHTLGRVLNVISSICGALNEGDDHDDDAAHSEVIFMSQKRIGQAIADLAMSSLFDVSFHEAVVSGNGNAENNAPLEFGLLDNQLDIVTEVLKELFSCYWSCLSLLPSRLVEDAVRTTPVRVFVGWCVDRMKYTAPPKGMLRLMCACVNGLMNQLNTCMSGTSKDANNPAEVTFLSIYRAHLLWLPQTEHSEAFDLLDLLNDNVAADLLAYDLLLLIKGLGDQRDEHQSQTESSLESLASIVAASAPRDPELAIKSLKEVPKGKSTNERLSKAFPRTARNGGSFNKKLGSFINQPRQEPLLKSFYLHVVLSSCFDRFDTLAKATKQRAGPSYMGEKIDAFVEHAAFAVRCLHVCARSQSHREYVGAILGDIFGTCLAMEDHSDGRVRLAGFEIFAAALDVLFLAQKATMLGAHHPTIPASDSSLMSMPSTPTAAGQTIALESGNNLMDATQELGEELNGLTSTTAGTRSINFQDSAKSANTSLLPDSPTATNGIKSTNIASENFDLESDLRINEIMAEGGSCCFHAEDTSSHDLAFEERAWQMLCAFISSSLGVGRFVDFVVQRACLEYLRSCMMNALRGRSSGASVLSFEHIEVIWEAVSRLVGSPWRALSSLAMWVTCAVVNVSVYATVTKGKGAARQRSSQLNDFAMKRVFERAESLLKSNSRENRVWGMQLLEVYVRSRDLNPNVLHIIPAAPRRVLRSLQALKNDWDEEVRERSQALLEIHFNSITRKSNGLHTLSAQAHSFMSIKRHMLDEYEALDPSRVELWFPPLPRQLNDKDLHVYQLKLESFASTPIVSGEEVSLVKIADESDNDPEDETVLEEDEGYMLDDGEGVDADQLKEQNNESREAERAENIEIENVVDADNNNSEEPHSNTNNEEFSSRNDYSQIGDLGEISSDSIEQTKVNGDEGSEEDEAPMQLSDDESLDISDEGVEIESDDVDDHEFTPIRPSSANDEDDVENDDVDVAVTNSKEILEDEVDEFGLVPIKTSSDGDDNEYEDELVVDVTDEDDVLVDVDAISDGIEVSSSSVSEGSMPIKDYSPRTNASQSGSKIKRSGTWSPNNLNPDLDEGKQVLRRMGSFTSRPHKSFTIEEGDAPKLERRRSVDVGSMSGGVRSSLDGEESSAKIGRLSRRKSMKPSVSPKVSDEGRENNAIDTAGMEKGKESTPDEDRTRVPNPVKLPRRKSMKVVAPRPEEKDETDQKAGSKVSSGRLKRTAVDEGKSNISDTAPETGKRTTSKEFDAEDLESRSPVSSGPTGLYGSSGLSPNVSKEHGKSDGKGNRPMRRSLPRAPAFVKGGGLPRRNSGPLQRPSDVGNVIERSSHCGGSGSLSSPTLLGASGKLRLGRENIQHAGSERTSNLEEADALERRLDRSHRFSRREPGWAASNDGDEFESELLNDVDNSEGQETKKRPSTPTANADGMRNSLIDEMPSPSSSYKRRGLKREVSGTSHFRKLMNELGIRTVEEEDTKDAESPNG